jgi:hypothetical protein
VGVELAEALPDPPHEFALDDAVGDSHGVQVVLGECEKAWAVETMGG